VNGLARAFAAAMKVAVGALCAAMLVRSLQASDLVHAAGVLRSVGPWAVVLVVPFAIAQALDAEAWRRVLATLGARVRLFDLYPVRVALEALTSSLPAGVIAAESVAPRFLEERHGVAPSLTVAAAGARRWLTMRAHAIYVAIGALAAFFAGPRLARTPWTHVAPLVVLGSALLPLGASVAISTTLGTGTRAGAIRVALCRLPVASLRRWLNRKRSAFTLADSGFAQLARESHALRAPTALLVVSWLWESVEAFVFLRIAGARLSLVEVLSFEAGLSVLKSAWFFAPSGLGAQDLGYLGVLHLFGVRDASAVGAAFLTLKRGRELAWIALGYGWMAFRGRRERPDATSLADATVPLSSLPRVL
jgi:uncharacterized membrane protein YbhN (UPF0104 family)